MTLLKLIEDEVRCGEVGHGIVVHLGDMFKNEASEGAIIRLPDVVSLCMCGGVGLGQGALQPFRETEAVSLDLEKEAPFLPIRPREVKAAIRGPGRVQHETFGDSDISGGQVGARSSRRVDIRTTRGGIRTRGCTTAGGIGLLRETSRGSRRSRTRRGRSQADVGRHLMKGRGGRDAKETESQGGGDAEWATENREVGGGRGGKYTKWLRI